MMLNVEHFPLAANIGDLLEAAVVIILMIMGAASHLITAKPKKPPMRQRPPQPPPNPGAPAGPGGQPLTLEESLRREVEEFMRRAQGREPATPSESPQRTPVQRPAAQRSAPTRPAPQRLQERRAAASSAPEPVVRRLTDAPGAQTTGQSPATTTPLGSGVGQHVAQHLGGTQALAAHAQSLGANVATADERMVAHLQQKFTHQVGALQQQDTITQIRAVRSPVAQALVDLLKQPGGVRQAVLASEILRRPEERWERERA